MLIKRVVGVAGDTIEQSGASLRLCHSGECRELEVMVADSRGDVMLKANLPSVIPEGYVFLAGEHPLSLDSRYLGLWQLHSVRGRLVPVLTTKIPEGEFHQRYRIQRGLEAVS